jgi:hypothetical protein
VIANGAAVAAVAITALYAVLRWARFNVWAASAVGVAACGIAAVVAGRVTEALQR